MTSTLPKAAVPGPDSLLALAFPSDPQVSPDGQRVAFVLSRIEEEDPLKPEPDHARPRYRSQLWLSEGGPARPFTAGIGRDHSPRWSPDGQHLAFVRDGGSPGGGQLYLIGLRGGEGQRLSGFKNGVQDVQWSPDGQHLSFLTLADDEDRRDERGEARVITRPRYRFNGLDWLPEMPARLWRYDLRSGQLTQWHAPEVGIAGYAWLPDSGGVLLISSADEFRASQWEQEIYRLPLNGPATQVTDWNSAIQAVVPHPDGQRFVIVGRPHGQGNTEYSKLHLIEPGATGAPGGRATCLDAAHDYSVGCGVGGDCHVGAMPATPVWLDDHTLLFSSTVRGTCGLFTVTLDGLVSARDHQPDTVIAAFSAQGGGVALIRERADHFPEVELNGVTVTDLHGRLPFAARTPQRVTFPTDLGEGEGWALLPGDGKPGQAPALLSIHGGPHTDYGHGFMHEFQLLAAHGYGVCYSNPRGSLGYGQRWQDDIHGRWGSVDCADLLTFFDTCLEQFPALDAGRTAVMGGSYGGLMTNWITGHTTRFQAAITDRSICNYLSFAGTSDIGLRFWQDELGLNFTRRADAQKLWDLSPLQYVENVQTPTLIVHSVLDHRCPIEQAEQWYAALVLQGVPVRFVRFPGENHELSRSGRPDRRLKRLQEYLDWLARWLNPAPAAG